MFIPSESNIVPVSRMGYMHDKETDGRTYVSFWDSASELYKMYVNRGSEENLSMYLTYVPPKD